MKQLFVWYLNFMSNKRFKSFKKIHYLILGFVQTEIKQFLEIDLNIYHQIRKIINWSLSLYWLNLLIYYICFKFTEKINIFLNFLNLFEILRLFEIFFYNWGQFFAMFEDINCLQTLLENFKFSYFCNALIPILLRALSDVF